jgi:FkbM family methyltransferase
MRSFLYRMLVRRPYFRGRDRIAERLRAGFRPAISSVYNDLLMQLDPIEHAQAVLLARGICERSTIELYQKLLNPGDSYVDVGAHVGFHALVARSLVGTEGQLIAIDPQPYNCDRILTNARLNGFDNIAVVVAAVGPKDGLVALNNQMPDDKSKLSLSQHWPHPETKQRFTFAMCRLDSLTSHLPSIKLLKIDVESYEWEVLQGASSALAKTENIIIELHPEGRDVARVAALLREKGFRLYDVHRNPWEAGQPCEDHNVWATLA